MQSIDVLVGRDALYHALPGDMRRQRKLHENAVHAGVAVQSIDFREQPVLRQIGRMLYQTRIDAAPPGRLHLALHIYLRRRILPDDDHADIRRAVSGAESFHTGGDFQIKFFGRRFSID